MVVTIGFGGWSGLGGRGQGDVEAEGFELPDVVSGSASDVDALVVEVDAEVVEGRAGVGEQVPDDDKDGSGDRDDRLEFAAAFDQASIAFSRKVWVLPPVAAASPSTARR